MKPAPFDYFRPASLSEALALLAKYKDDCKILAGGQSLVPAMNFRLARPGVHDQLVQVFLNLILNAIDATAKNGRIEIRAAAERGGIRVEVRDDGPGIPPEQAARLFQPYFTTKKHGTGLGLFVTRQLVADHGGDVAFDSTRGEGTVFRVWAVQAAVFIAFATLFTLAVAVRVPLERIADPTDTAAHVVK